MEVADFSDLKTYPEGIPVDTVSLDSLNEVAGENPWKYFVIHTTATSQNATPDAILRYWKTELGWVNPGYHFLIPVDGSIWVYKHYDFSGVIKPEDIVNSVKGMNRYSIAVSYVGGIDEKGNPKDTRTDEQKETLDMLVSLAKKANPGVMIVGHRDIQVFSNKACPSFNVQNEYLHTSFSEMGEDTLHNLIMRRVKFFNENDTL